MNCNYSSTGLKLNAGYTVMHGISVETGYTSYGSFRTMDDQLPVTLKPRAVQFGAAVAVPFSTDWGMSIRLGVARVSPKASSSTPGYADAATTSKVYAGAGVTYAVTPNAKLTLATERAFGKLADPKADLRLYSAGVILSF